MTFDFKSEQFVCFMITSTRTRISSRVFEEKPSLKSTIEDSLLSSSEHNGFFPFDPKSKIHIRKIVSEILEILEEDSIQGILQRILSDDSTNQRCFTQ